MPAGYSNPMNMANHARQITVMKQGKDSVRTEHQDKGQSFYWYR